LRRVRIPKPGKPDPAAWHTDGHRILLRRPTSFGFVGGDPYVPSAGWPASRGAVCAS
jgi:hypothetical protein